MKAKPVSTGARVSLKIIDLGRGGEGVGRYEDLVVFVPGAIPGDTVAVEITAVKKKFARGKILAVEEPSPSRVPARCEVAGWCGGCDLQHMRYSDQLKYKEKAVRDALVRIGGFRDRVGSLVRPIIGAENPWFYRNKAQFPFGVDEGRVVTGYYARGTHEVVPAVNCSIQHPLANRIATEVRRLAEEHGLTVYKETTDEGFLRHLVIRVGTGSGEALAVLVTRHRTFPEGRELARRLMEAVPELVGVVQNINPRQTNVIMGKESRVLAGRGSLVDQLGGLRFRISPGSFFQVNPEQTEVLYNKVVEYAGLDGTETVVDAYCGIGTIALFLARRAAKVYGIEVVKEAVEDARYNARLNGIGNVDFRVGAVEEILQKLASPEHPPDLVVLDPPRKGCDEETLEVLVRIGVPRVVYVSCNPATLARDLGWLNRRGYTLLEVQPVDMFPHTGHVECCCLLKANNEVFPRPE